MYYIYLSEEEFDKEETLGTHVKYVPGAVVGRHLNSLYYSPSEGK